ncbi:hypothetical protein CKAH01_09696 [Colletotrichum kahawae]|uniref:Uncharacterized protein n=1 Tax=Colletotrichum kahawae TaxID=34407 RepID=A0AAD9XXR7_COLKA|nr:hypothetical protein CKAH01_09696 [Colletotrichum kahawae]
MTADFLPILVILRGANISNTRNGTLRSALSAPPRSILLVERLRRVQDLVPAGFKLQRLRAAALGVQNRTGDSTGSVAGRFSSPKCECNQGRYDTRQERGDPERSRRPSPQVTSPPLSERHRDGRPPPALETWRNRVAKVYMDRVA